MKTSLRFILPALLAAALSPLHGQAPAPAAAPAPAPAPAAAPAAAETKPAPLPALSTILDPETVALFASMPVQESGRIKPLDTLARFRLLRFSGRQSYIKASRMDEAAGEVPIKDAATGQPIATAKGSPQKFSAIEWLLITWFRPDVGKDLPVFVVDNSGAVIELGLDGKALRDRYSYNEIAPGRDTLLAKMQELRQKQAAAKKERKDPDFSPVERALSKLAIDFLDYEMMLNHFDFARAPFAGQTDSLPPELAALTKDGRVTDWAAFIPKLEEYFKAHPEAAAPMQNPWFGAYFRVMLGARMSGDDANQLRNIPPPADKVEVWHGPGPILQASFQGEEVSKADLAHLNAYAGLSTAANDPAAFKATVKKFHDDMESLAKARGESGHIGLELSYHKKDYFYQALLCFTFGLLLLALSWVKRSGSWEKWTKIGCVLLLTIGSIYGTVGIIIRCVIMQRPPITTLYETIIFITTACVIMGLLAEWASKRGYALIVAAVAGTAGMFLSLRFFTFEGADSMRQLEAVLITTFWLSTHVPCINLGYAMGMVASIFSMVYLFGRMFGMQLGSAAAKDITRMSYAFVLAGLLFSLVGTVLGGIWANYSWGRFWGWDPKENGALMIVLMNLIILHARLGGQVKEAGFHALGMLLGIITIFSWFATNQLGIGLHSYGAMENAWMWLYLVWGFMLLLMVFGIIRARLDRSIKPTASKEADPTLGAPQKA